MTLIRSLNAAMVVLCTLFILDTPSDKAPFVRGVLIGIAGACTFGALYEEHRP